MFCSLLCGNVAAKIMVGINVWQRELRHFGGVKATKAA